MNNLSRLTSTVEKQLTDHLQKELRRDQVLLDAIKRYLPELESLLFEFRSDYEGRTYRFYYQSFKVYRHRSCCRIRRIRSTFCNREL